MSLDKTKLENVKEKGGNWIARCPACAKNGGDTKGEHLFLASDGKFGCVAHPDDKSHRKEIYQLVGIQISGGQREPIPIRIRRPACVTRIPKTILVLKSLTVPTPPPSTISEERPPESQSPEPVNSDPCEAPKQVMTVEEAQNIIREWRVFSLGTLLVGLKEGPDAHTRIQAYKEAYTKEGRIPALVVADGVAEGFSDASDGCTTTLKNKRTGR